MIKGIIFDFNGTLFQDSDKHEAAWRQFALEQFDRQISDEEFIKNIHGKTNHAAVEYIAGKSLSFSEVQVYVEQKEINYRKLCEQDTVHCRLEDDVLRLLDTLKKRNFPITIATAAPKSNLDFYIRKFHLQNWFDLKKIVSDNGMIPGKPEPDFYLHAAEAIHIPASECLVFEDAVSGIQSAYRAGIGQIIAIDYSGTFSELLRKQPGVSGIIHSFDEFDSEHLF